MSGTQPHERTPVGVARRIPRVSAAAPPPRSQSDDGAQSTSGTLLVTVSRFDGWTLVAIAGEIDGVTAIDLHRVLEEFADESVALDLVDVTFLGSSGLRTLMRAHERIVLAGGRLAIRSPRPNVQRVFESTGLTDGRADDPTTT